MPTSSNSAPIYPGGRISHEYMPDNLGTFGCLVIKKGKPSPLFILSNAHVLALHGIASKGQAIIYHPNHGTPEKIAEFEEHIRLIQNRNTNLCDAAIAKVTSDRVKPDIPEIGIPKGHANIIMQGMSVKLFGSTSHFQTAEIIDDVPISLNVDYKDYNNSRYTVNYNQQYRYSKSTPTGYKKVTKAGDSGAVVLDNDKLIIGLHFWGSGEDIAKPYSVFSPIKHILDELNLEIVTEEIYKQSQNNIVVISSAITHDNIETNATHHNHHIETEEKHSQLDLINEKSIQILEQPIRSLFEVNNFQDSISWRLTPYGLEAGGIIDRSPGQLLTVPKVWELYQEPIKHWSEQYKIPVELIVATICTESAGKHDAIRREPGFISNINTPNKISVGLMQTLISTARESLGNEEISAKSLLDQNTSIQAGTSYINDQRFLTNLDPPKVSCAYNAGSLYYNKSPMNRWKMKQYPINTGIHADRFIKWFNDCFAFFRQSSNAPECSFYKLSNE